MIALRPHDDETIHLGPLPGGIKDILLRALECDATDVDMRPDRTIDFTILDRIVHTDRRFDEALRDDIISYLGEPSVQRSSEEGGGEDPRAVVRFAKDLDNDERTRVRVTRYPAINPAGNSYAIRLLPMLKMTREQAGVPERFYTAVRDATGGIAFVTGITGSGKTTTINIIARDIAFEEAKKVVTIESPMEIIVDDEGAAGSVTQMEIGADFRHEEEALETCMTIRPRYIFVWEIRTRRVAELALSLAESGHIVVVCMHTRTARETIDRIVSFWPINERAAVAQVVASKFIGALGQRLLVNREATGFSLVCDLLLASPAVLTQIREQNFDELEAQMWNDETSGNVPLDMALMRAAYDEKTITPEAAFAATVDKVSYVQQLGRRHSIPSWIPGDIRKMAEA